MWFFDQFRPGATSATVVSELVPAIFGFANQSAKAVYGALEQSVGASVDPYAGSHILFDFLFFNYQWIDRVAYNTLGPKRDVFMEALRASLMTELADISLQPGLSGPERRQATERLERMLDEFLREFGGYNATPATQGGEVRGTLFYEIGRRVAQSAGRPRHSLIIAQASMHAMSSVKGMDVPRVLAKLR